MRWVVMGVACGKLRRIGRRAFVYRALLAGLCALAPLSSAAQSQSPVTVFAAISMKEALEAAAARYRDLTGQPVVHALASSSVLARQIDAGARADLFVSANSDWMDWLADRRAVDAASRRDIAGNRLVVARRDGVSAGTPAEALAGSGRVAMGDPSHVPAGIYARRALEQSGLWPNVSQRAVFGENVRVALTIVERGEVEAAIVYRSDMRAVPGLSAAHVFDPASHGAIVYPAALTLGASEAARAYLDFLAGDEAAAIFMQHGFVAPP